MDTPPLDHNPVPGTGTRNVTVSLALWLRKMGFTVVEQGGLLPTGLVAVWRESKMQYELLYAYEATGGLMRLTRTKYPLANEVIIDGATVHRIREARFLLLSSKRYACDRKAALDAGTLTPTYAQHTD